MAYKMKSRSAPEESLSQSVGQSSLDDVSVRAEQAEKLAAAAVCSGVGARPCGKCRDCRKAAEHVHPTCRTWNRKIYLNVTARCAPICGIWRTPFL